VVVDACSNSDLFWALRGGGGGTFGVVTNVKYRLHPVTPISLIFWGVDPTTAPSVEANLQFVKQWLE
jgi:FAD/FMN-containing dehydrogenase